MNAVRARCIRQRFRIHSSHIVFFFYFSYLDCLVICLFVKLFVCFSFSNNYYFFLVVRIAVHFLLFFSFTSPLNLHEICSHCIYGCLKVNNFSTTFGAVKFFSEYWVDIYVCIVCTNI